MAQLPSTLGRAGLLSSDVLELQVTEHGPHARVVTVGGEIDALTAPGTGRVADRRPASRCLTGGGP
ncbi:MAG: hypothetical protein M3460_26750 [Actinomycetota bacterium]|nr:hypothetical protein [Actinomycetota bacterium]